MGTHGNATTVYVHMSRHVIRGFVDSCSCGSCGSHADPETMTMLMSPVHESMGHGVMGVHETFMRP